MSEAIRLASEQNAAIYRDSFFGQESYFDFESLTELLPADISGFRALDIGAGNAVVACRLAAERDISVLCTEHDAVRVRLAHQNVFMAGLDGEVRVAQADMDRMETKVYCGFDLVIALDSLQHSKDLERLLARILGGGSRPILAAAIWCCNDPTLARRWGFDRHYLMSDVARWVCELRPMARVRRDTQFGERFARYLVFLEREERRLAELIGAESATERKMLVEATLGAIEKGDLAQLVVAA